MPLHFSPRVRRINRRLISDKRTMANYRKDREYYFVDIELASRQIISRGIEGRETVEVTLNEGFHRVFLSKGRYNKLSRSIKDG